MIHALKYGLSEHWCGVERVLSLTLSLLIAKHRDGDDQECSKSDQLNHRTSCFPLDAFCMKKYLILQGSTAKVNIGCSSRVDCSHICMSL